MKLRDKLKALKAAQAEYHKKANDLTSPQIAAEVEKFNTMRAGISAEITDGAKNCPDCGNVPHGIFHDGTPNPFEIGCLLCRDHRVRGALPEDAVEDWNAGKYLPPREPGTVEATHRDATGKVKSQKILKAQPAP
jgi:hypothetical protein